MTRDKAERGRRHIGAIHQANSPEASWREKDHAHWIL